jgi:hypothetical protein
MSGMSNDKKQNSEVRSQNLEGILFWILDSEFWILS